MAEQRSHPRYLCSDLVMLHWKAGERRRQATVVLESISTGGACVQAEFTLPELTPVRITCGKENFRGVVRYCLSHVGGSFLGVEWDADSRWSKSKYLPRHLLDPSKVRPRTN